MDYDAPATYDRLIGPRFAPIADALVERARLRPGEAVLELGAGTGLVTTRADRAVGPDGSILATDRAPAMLAVARRRVPRRAGLGFVVADYAAPLPFLDASFDVVLAGLTYVQDSPSAVREVARVLRPRGRLALSMWGTSYGEVRMMSAARRRLGQPPYPSAAPGRAVRRLTAAGFRAVRRHDIPLAPRFASVDAYIAYRRGFGVPTGSTPARHDRYLRALEAEASGAAASDGSLTLDWTVVVITATRPARTG